MSSFDRKMNEIYEHNFGSKKPSNSMYYSSHNNINSNVTYYNSKPNNTSYADIKDTVSIYYINNVSLEFCKQNCKVLG